MQLMKLQVKKEAPEGIFNTNQKQNDITAAFIYRFACVRRADIWWKPFEYKVFILAWAWKEAMAELK